MDGVEMMVPAVYVRHNQWVSGLQGLGDEYNLAYPDNPCAAGLTLINGSCFRSPGTQVTPYGTVAIPLAGPVTNLDIAEDVLGNGAVCATERVSSGPYAYEQNICRDRYGNVIGGADLIAEHAFVQEQLYSPPAVVSYGSAPKPAPKPDLPPLSSGSGSGSPAQNQTPAQNPKTVQGSEQTTGNDPLKMIEGWAGDFDLSGSKGIILLIGAGLGLYLLMGRGR